MHRPSLVLAMALLAATARAQTPASPAPAMPPPQTTPLPPSTPLPDPTISPAAVAPEKVTFDEAVRRATSGNPTAVVAAAEILRAQALLTAARALTLPQVTVNGTNTTLNSSRGVAGQVFTPQNTFSAALSLSVPLFAPAQWARRTQALDAQRVAEAGSVDVNRQVAVATAQAFLSVIGARRVVESQVRARDTAQAFFDYASNRLQVGAGSKLTALQAQQTLSSDQALVELAQLSLYRAQEALGVLVAADVPVDALDEPAFEIPDEATVVGSTDQAVQQRTDIRLGNLEVVANRRIVSDSWKDWLPSVTGIFQPAFQHPGSVITPQTSWAAFVQFEVPVFDAGTRRSLRQQREVTLKESQVTLTGQVREARAEIRRAYESVRRSERVLDSSRAAAVESAQVLDITQVSFRAGAATNLDVIDAQRRARDADTAVAVAEDSVRQSRLDLLTALGRFPK
jgi:outer membrane protein TolC